MSNAELIDEARRRLTPGGYAPSALLTLAGKLADALEAAERELRAAQAVIAEARSYYGVNETAWVVKVLDGASTDALQAVKAAAWDEGAKWAAVECGAIRDERNGWIAPGDNPYRTAPSTPEQPEGETT